MYSMGMNFVSSQENLNVQMIGHFYKGTVSKMLNQKILPRPGTNFSTFVYLHTIHQNNQFLILTNFNFEYSDSFIYIYSTVLKARSARTTVVVAVVGLLIFNILILFT